MEESTSLVDVIDQKLESLQDVENQFETLRILIETFELQSQQFLHVQKKMPDVYLEQAKVR